MTRSSLHLLYPAIGLVVMLLAITLLRVVYLYTTPFDLFFDEAQYWGWAQSFQWGYYSKPPVIAWLIALTTSLCGDYEACVRLASPLLHGGTSVAIYLLGSLLCDKRVGWVSAIVYATLPAVSLSSMLISTDAPLLFCWAWAMVGFVKAIQTNRYGWWLFAGLCAGLGMLSKYNMLIFALSALLFIFLGPHYQPYLKQKGFWSASLVALLVFTPNIIWNAHNHFASFFHTKDNASLGFTLHFEHMLEFIGSQFGVFGPIFFAILLIVFSQYMRPSQRKHYGDSYRLLLCFIVPMLLLIVGISLISRAHANWAAPIYVPATVLVVAWLIERGKHRWIYCSMVLHVAVALAAMLSQPIIEHLPLTLTGKKTFLTEGKIKDPFRRVKGWREVGKQVSKRKQEYPDAVILTYTRRTHAELLYYVEPKPFDIVKWNPNGTIGDHYDLTTDINAFAERDFLLVSESNNRPDILSRFEKVTTLEEINIPLYPDFSRRYDLYYLQGFKGYDTAH